MKKYETPTLEEIKIEFEDIMGTSGDYGILPGDTDADPTTIL